MTDDIDITIRHEALTESQRARMPNLFLIGAGKCGTTSLHSYLSAHPEIVGAREKEPSFFVDNQELRQWQLMESMRPAATDLEAYLDLFGPGAERARYRLESSPTYSSYPDFTGIPERIAAASPSARLIYLVRNPVDRAISHYWQDRKILREERPMTEALTEVNIYSTSSDYKMQLDRYRPHFKDILIVKSEELRAAPQQVLSRLFEALGLEDHQLDPSLLDERNRTPGTTRAPRHPLFKRLRDTRAWNRLRSHLPRGGLDLVRKLAVRDVPRTTEDEPAMRRMLTTRFAPMVEDLDKTYGTNMHDSWFNGR